MPAYTHQTFGKIRISGNFIQNSRGNRRVGKITEHAIDTQLVELNIFLYRAAIVVCKQTSALIAESVGMYQQANSMGILHNGCFGHGFEICFIHHTVAVYIACFAVSVSIRCFATD